MSFVLDAVEDVFDFVVDEIIDPVMTTVSGVIEAALDDPIKTIAQIAAVVSGHPELLPLIEGADVAIAGGDLGDVLEATAKAYVVQQVGSYVGEAAGDWAKTNLPAETSAATAKVISTAVTEGVRGATVAVVTGQDPLKALVTGGISAGVSATLGQVQGFAAFQKSNPTVAAAIAGAVGAAISGDNVTAAVVNSAITASGIVKEIFEKSDVKMTDAQKAIATDILMGTATAAITGGSAANVVRAAMLKNGSKALGDMVKNSVFTSATDKTTTSYKNYENASTALADNEADQKEVADNYNDLASQLEIRIDEQKRLKGVYDKAVEAFNKNQNATTQKAANDAAAAYNDYVKDLNKDYGEFFKPKLDAYSKELNTLQTQHDKLVTGYESASKDFKSSVDKLTDSLDSVYTASDRAFVEAMDPNFKAEEYRKLNGLSADADVYDHYLGKGQFEGALTNYKAAEGVIGAERTRLVTQALAEKGLDIATADPEQVSKILDTLDTKYGNNVAALKAATAQDVIKGNTVAINQLLKDQKDGVYRVDADVAFYGDWNKPKASEFTLPAGMRYATKAEVANGSASRLLSDNADSVYVVADDKTAVQTWDPKTGGYIQTLPEVVITATRPTDAEKLVMYGTDPDSWTGVVGKAILNASETMVKWAKETGNSTLINTAANVLKAGGGFLNSINGISVLAGYAPKNTAFGKFATALENLGKANNTAEYQAAVKNMQGIIGDAKGVGGTLKAIYGAFKSAPMEFLAEYVGVEGIQEVAPLLIGGVAATGAKGAALALKYGQAVATKMGTATGMTTSILSDITESAGGAAQSAYTDAYNTAKKAGKSDAEADKIALDIAQRAALVAGGTTAVTMGIGGAALEKAILGKTGTGMGDALQALGDFAKTGTKITIKEGVTEAGEEGITQAFLESQLYKLDPTRDVAGNITAAAAFGAIAGGPIAGGAYSADRAGDVISNALMGNADVANAISTAPNAAAASTALKNLGVTDSVTQANLLNTKYDSAYTSSYEAESALSKRSDFVYSDADIKALTGATSNANLTAEVEKYVDPRVLDVAEVKAAAAAEGYTISDADAAKLAGQKDETTGVAAVKKQYDPLAVTEQEAKDFFAKEGYTPTKADIAAYVGNKKESDVSAAITAKYDPLATTEAEVRDFFKTQGYTPTAAEIAAYVGNKKESDIGSQIATKYDPLAVTEQEAKDFFAKEGYTPTAKELAEYIGNKKESDIGAAISKKYDPLAVTKEEALATAKGEGYTLTDKEIATYIGNKSEKDTLAAIVKYADPLAVTEAEAKAFFAEQGYTPSKEELAEYVGQKSETQIAKDIIAYADPKAVTAAEAKDFFTKLGYTPTDAQIKQFTKVADEVQTGKDIAAYVDPRQVTAAEAKSFLEGLGYKPTQAEINKFVSSSDKTIQDAIKGDVAKYVDPLLVDKDEVKQAFIDAGFKDVTDDDVARFIGQYAEKDLSGKVSDYLPIATYNATKLQIEDVEESLLDKMAEYEKAGISRDQALDKAIDDVAAELDTTRTDILDIIGTPAVADDPATKDVNEAKPSTGIYATIDAATTELGGQITDLSADVQAKYDALSDSQKDLADALTKQGVDLNAAIEAARTSLQTDIGAVKETIGTKGTPATQTDLDAIINALETQGAYDPTLDYNGDKVIDQKDKIAIEQALRQQTGQNIDQGFVFTPAAGSKWAPTGIYADLAANQAATNKAITDEAERTRQAASKNAQNLAKLGNINSLVGMLGQAQDLGGQQVTVKAADPAKIGYIYDWSSIFANPSQEKMFMSPYGTYAQGGVVRDELDDVNDELLKILRG